MRDDDGTAEMFGGFWLLIRKFMMLFFPLWVFLILYSANVHMVISAIVAGFSTSLVAIFEKLKIKQANDMANKPQ